ncbi:MAG: class I SAM-dependent RNA methyltransferase [Clostridia bacterium]|nr:class I SAM-dependent RNA methyltransferase [Clostridia bacterium]
MEWIASAAFGMEGMTGRDLKHMGMADVQVLPVGGAAFRGSFEDAFRASLWLRTCDRILLVMGRFEARSFEELVQGVKDIPWEGMIPADGAFPVRARCVKSQLMSPSDVQKIVKRAMVERLKGAYGADWFTETGAMFQVDVSIREDVVTVALDASGEPLSKRGYRTWNGEAPLRETLAAALVLQSGWHPWQPLHDPCCGTGTILIEAAFIALDRAPGLTRKFAMEAWPAVPHGALDAMRAEARRRFEAGLRRPISISGSDISPEAVELAQRHLKQAGLAGRIALSVRDMRDLAPGEALALEPPGTFIANPPYGERLDNVRSAHAVAHQLGALQERFRGWTLCAFSADTGFEEAYGRRADRRRRYYNGRIECEYRVFLPGRQKAPRPGRRGK